MGGHRQRTHIFAGRTPRMPRSLSLIGAPSSAGAYAPGQEKAPATFRRHGLVPALQAAGLRVRDRGDVAGFRWRPDSTRPNAMNLDFVARTAAAVADVVAEAMAADEDVLVLGGDCTIELGTVAGASRGEDSLGIVYVDLDVDLNPPAASDGALDWTGVAHLLDLPGAASELSGLGPRRPMLAPDAILFFAASNVTASESETLRALGLERISLAEVKADPRAAAARAVAWAARHDRLLVHLDADVLSYTEFPIAENVRRCPGLSLDELAAALAGLVAAPNWRALTLAEVNPDHAPDEAEAFRRLNDLLCGALGP
jgi:arginase